MRRFFAGLLLIATVQFANGAEVIHGSALVVDGDTLEIGGRQVRLLGIDAPEGAQELPIASGGTDFVGRGAAIMLRALITENSIRCELAPERDSRGLPLARCTNGAVDLASEMIASGMAWAVPGVPSPYKEAEARAKLQKKGFWRDMIEAPWLFRERRSKDVVQRSGSACAVKGIIDGPRKTLITPWSPWYFDVEVDAVRGDRWFCNEAEAIGQGFRAPLWLMGSVVSGVYDPKR